MKVEAPAAQPDDTPTARCVTCGDEITADDFDALWARYTHHQVDEHDKPSTVEQARNRGLPSGRSMLRLTFKCEECGNVNVCETKVDWDEPPVACHECGASDWDRTNRKVLGR